MITKLQKLAFIVVFTSFVFVCSGLASAIFWATAFYTDEAIKAERDLDAVLQQIGGQTIQIATTQDSQPVAIVQKNSSTEQEQNTMPLPETSYRSDFNINLDAFGFRNYGSSFPQGNLSIAEVRQLYGDAVCVRIEGENCIATPAAQLWIEQMNDAMRQGHCLGFTILAYDLFSGQVTRQQFQKDADTTNRLIQQSMLMRTIAQRWTLQTTPELLNAAVVGTPREIIAKLLELKQTVDLGIFGRKGGGHSMLAYGVESKGNGLYHILVYDNNWPDRESFVEVDATKNSWRYTLSSENPDEQPTIWDGDGKSQTLIFVPLTAYHQAVTCPFCAAPAAAAKPGLALLENNASLDNFNIVAITGEAGRLQVTTEQGARSGHFGDEYVNQIADALLIRPRSALYHDGEPMILLPPNQEFTVQVEPRDSIQSSSTSLRIIGGNLSVAVDNLAIMTGAADQLTITPTESQIRFLSAGNQSPTLKFAFVHNGTTYLGVLNGAQLQANQELKVGFNSGSGDLEIASQGGSDQQSTFVLTKIDENGSTQFATDQFLVAGNGMAALAVTNWLDTSDLPLSIDQGADGSVDQTMMLVDQPVRALFNAQFQPDQVVDLLDEMAPYLQPVEKQQLQEALLVAVQGGEISASQMGEILFNLDQLGMTTEELATFVQSSGMPVEEQAAMLTNLNLEEEQEKQVIDAIAPSTEEKSALNEQLALLDEAAALVNRFEFSNQPLQDFDSFVASQNVSPGIERLLPQLANYPEQNTTVSSDILADQTTTQNISASQVSDLSTTKSSSVESTATTQPVNNEEEISAASVITTTGSTATALPTGTATPLPTNTATPLPTNTATSRPTNTATPRPTNTATPQPTNTATSRPTNTVTPRSTNTATPRPTNTATPRPTNTATPRPTNTATPRPTDTATLRPTNTATPRPTNTATPRPTNTATPRPTDTATLRPTNTVTSRPTNTATLRPTNTATPRPTNTATPRPTNTATPRPTNTATPRPTNTATSRPTNTATPRPTNTATPRPTNTATPRPTNTATSRPTNTATPRPTNTATPRPTNTSVPPTNTSVPPTNTSVPPTNTSVPPTNTSVPPTNTSVPPTNTSVPPTNTSVPPTNTSVPPTNTSVPPTNTSVPPTNTSVPPTNTSVPPTNTSVPPTNTSVPPTSTSVPPTNTLVPPTNTSVPPTNTLVPPTNTPVPPTNTLVPPTETFTPVPPEPTATALVPSPTSILEIPTPVP